MRMMDKGEAYMTKMWDHYLPFETEEYVTLFLSKKYGDLDRVNHKRMAYRNTPKFIAYAKLGRTFFQAGEKADLLARPMLYYYGMVSLLKLLLLLDDPDYPSQVAQLAHGVTTRKMKRSPYIWLEDEVKIQREGLLPSLLRRHMIEMPNAKIKMRELIRSLDEMRLLLQSLPFPLSTGDDGERIPLPDYILYALLAYHLGMLSRYEGEIWLEITGSYPMEKLLIYHLLHRIPARFPFLIIEEIGRSIPIDQSTRQNNGPSDER